MTLIQIYCIVCVWKNLENRSASGELTTGHLQLTVVNGPVSVPRYTHAEGYCCKKYQLVTVPDLNARQMFLELLYLHQRLQSMDKWAALNTWFTDMLMLLYCKSIRTSISDTMVWGVKAGSWCDKFRKTFFITVQMCWDWLHLLLLHDSFTLDIKLTCSINLFH